MTSTSEPYYKDSVKSDISDEIINTYLLRPIAHQLVRLLCRTRVTPNQVTVASIVAGIVAAVVYAVGGQACLPVAGLLVTVKDLLDSADGQLARARNLFSRFGRFLDSVGDFAVNLLVFAGISVALYNHTGYFPVVVGGVLGFLGISLRVSYHVFYQTSFLHLQSAYEINRVTEEIQQEDLNGDPRTLSLQRLFQFLYGWQDRLMMRIDRWSMAGLPWQSLQAWYSDRVALVLSGFLGLGTELFLLMLFSLLRRLDLYLIANIVVMNALWAMCVGYRRTALRRRWNIGSPK